MKKQIYKVIIFVFILVPPVIFYGLFFRYTINIPINDDYKAILDFLNNCIGTDSISEKIKLIFSQHNEHRIVYDRIWTIICYKLNGQVNFNFLAFLGNLSLIGIFFIFYKKTLLIKKQIIYLIPISVLIFNISFHENMTFAMATMSNLTVFLFSLLSLYFLTKEVLSNKNLICAIIFFILATFTQGGGLFLVPISILILIYRKQKRVLITYIFVSLIIITSYFYGYQKPEYHPSILSTIIDFKVRAILFSFAFLGNAFDYNLIFTNDLNESIGITSIIGFVFFVIYLHVIKTKYYNRNLFVFSTMSLIVLTSFITGFTRCQLGLETAGASRYRINGVIFLLGLYLWFIDTKIKNDNSKKINILIFSFSLIYLIIFSVNQYEYLSFRKRQTLLGVIYYHSGDHTKLNGFEQDFYKKTLIKSQQEQTYTLPTFNLLQQYFPYSKKEVFKNDVQNSDQFTISVDNITKIKDSYLIEGWAFVENESTQNQEVYIGLKNKSDSNPVYFSTNQIPKFDLNPYFKKFNLENGGYSARIKDNDIKLGENSIWIKIKVNGIIKIKETDKKLIK